MRLIIQHRSTRGSILVVIMVAVVLGILAGAAMMMSTSYKRRDVQESLRYTAQLVARATAEEAALLIHNGKVNMVIDQALKSKVDFTSRLEELGLFEKVMRNHGVKQGITPRVTVVAALANPKGLNLSKVEQWDMIVKEVTAANNEEGKKFWTQDMISGDDGDIIHNNVVFDPKKNKTAGDAKGDDTAAKNEGFWNGYVKGFSLDRMCQGKRVDFKDVVVGQDASGKDITKKQLVQVKNGMDAINDLLALFGDKQSEVVTDDFGKSATAIWYTLNPAKSPDVGTFKQKWEAALQCVGKDAGSKVEACGSNPAAAMAHLAGDFRFNEVVASGTERQAAKDFLESDELSVTNTFMLEITAECQYERSGGQMSGTVSHTTYRLFQRAPWDQAVDQMTRSFVKCLITGCNGKHARFTPADIAAMWSPSAQGASKGPFYNVPDPSNPDDPAQATGTQYDPYQVFSKPLEAMLPSAVGSRLYPYTMCDTSTNPRRFGLGQ